MNQTISIVIGVIMIVYLFKLFKKMYLLLSYTFFPIFHFEDIEHYRNNMKEQERESELSNKQLLDMRKREKVVEYNNQLSKEFIDKYRKVQEEQVMSELQREIWLKQCAKI